MSELFGSVSDYVSEGDTVNFFANYIGGMPVGIGIQSSNIDWPLCNLCHQVLQFVLQMYCPIDENSGDRILLVFVCQNPTCIENAVNWKVFRMSSSKKKEIFNDSAPAISASDWTFDDDEDDAEAVELAAKFASTSTGTKNIQLSSETPSQAPSSASFQPCPSNENIFQCRYIEVTSSEEVREDDDDLSPSDSDNDFCDDDDNRQPGAFSTSLMNLLMNRKLPSSTIIRYHLYGKPCFNRSLKNNWRDSLPRCAYCKSRRIFEFQLLPRLPNFLVPQSLKSNDSSVAVNISWNLEFSTILVFTCEQNCIPPNVDLIEELVVVQPANMK